MSTLATIGVDNNLTTCESCVTVRTSDYEFSRGVHVVFDIQTEEIEHLLRVNLLFHAGNEDIDDVVFDLGEHLLILVKFVVLGRNHDGIDALGNTLVGVLHCYLALGVRTQVCHLLAFLTDISQCAHDQVGQVETDRHIALCLIGCISEHHTLVAGTLFVFVSVVHTAVDVGTLLMDGTQDTARITVALV